MSKDWEGSHTLTNELLFEDINSLRMFFDNLIHEWLGKGRLVDFVVSESSVAHNINYNVLVELLSEHGGKLEDPADGVNVITVYVKNWRSSGFSDVGTVLSRSGVLKIVREILNLQSYLRTGGKTNLVVKNNVDGTSGVVVPQARHSNSFVDYTLANKRGITVNKHWHASLAIFIALFLLFASYLSLYNRVYSFEMRWVGQQRKVNLLKLQYENEHTYSSVRSFSVARSTQMVLHITGSVFAAHRSLLELVKDGRQGLMHDVREDIQTTSVWHSNRDT